MRGSRIIRLGVILTFFALRSWEKGHYKVFNKSPPGVETKQLKVIINS